MKGTLRIFGIQGNLLDSFLDRLFGENRRQAEAIMGIIAIIGAGLVAIHLINKRSLKWRSQALVEFEKIWQP